MIKYVLYKPAIIATAFGRQYVIDPDVQYTFNLGMVNYTIELDYACKWNTYQGALTAQQVYNKTEPHYILTIDED